MGKNPHGIVPEMISRKWGTYAVKAVVSEDVAKERGAPWPKLTTEEILEYSNKEATGVESHIYLWPTPVVVKSNDINEILIFRSNDKSIRLYPPFVINEPSETSGAFEDVTVPEGEQRLERFAELPVSGVRGARMQHGVGEGLEWCRGFRLDVESGGDGLSVLREFLAHVAQFTYQWWLRASHNPMHGPLRMGGSIDKDHSIRHELRYEGAGDLESTWYGAVQYQLNLGYGEPLTRGTWLLCAHHTQEGRKPDQGLLSFHDGMADFMAGNDEKAILNLCIATEIMLSKHSLIVLGRPPSSLDQMVRKSPLLGDGLRATLRKLVMDRNCVAHGREPRMLRSDDLVTIELYIVTVKELVSQYLAAMPAGKWSEVMDLKLDNEKIFRSS